ncbi:T9SS type A sorting domain-containing protein [Sinomicrobium kalidii]|uniref:LamG-like jellyroll fold domain-containing protein n=1 Tax=Sinomicrobium kalidii TaxID=2900738 RepID=UPI001E375D74|nr:LamG-like jellyroll fold domain-containing protein [Sinomicrobium kalidii]UGU18199.1 T9SS type A sorting domain-containing protein [Sinomicrobium kalidii]
MITTEIFSNRRTNILLWLVLLTLWSIPDIVFSQTPAFPEAEGFGRYATGGRFGGVYIVTNLNDSGPGSFRDAVSQPNRIVVFEVGGVIRLKSRVVVSENITVAGQTAPGDGIVIYGDGFSYTQASNSIIRYLRMRMGRIGTSGADAVGITDDAKHIIFDHVSASWGRDETFSITRYADSITIQNCIIAQGLETHSAGGLIEPSGKVSLYRNLYIDNNTRNPKVKGINQFVNNVVYNWGRGGGYIMGGSAGDSFVNIINNYLVKGPSTTIEPFTRGTETFIPYVEGNYYDDNLNGVLDGYEVPLSAYEGITTFRDTPYDYPMPAQVFTAEETFGHVMENAGANYPRRDPVDDFLITELASIGVSGALISDEMDLPTQGPGEVFGAPALQDTDRDGIPDTWENANGLNPENASDAMQINAEGYANIEVYINNLAETPAPDFLRPPSGVASDSVSTTGIGLTWKNNDSRTTGIVIERSDDSTNYQVLDTLGGDAMTYLDNELEPGTMYRYRLRAYNAAFSSVYTTPLDVETTPVPTVPDAPVSPAPGDQSIYADTTGLRLSWTGSENTDAYTVYLSSHPDSLQQVAALTDPFYDADTLQSGTTYYWRADAANELGTTTGSVWSFTTLPYFPKGVAGAWLMDEDGGASVVDSSSYANHAEINGVPGYDRVEGKVGRAVDLNTGETSSHIRVPHRDHLYMGKQSFTISMWLKSSSQDNQSYLVHKGTFNRDDASGATGRWYGIEVKDGDIRFAVDDDITKTQLSVDAGPFFTGEWIHLVAVRDRETDVLRLYRNGVLINEATDRTEENIGQQAPVIIANSSNLDTPFRGQLDEFRIFNYGLSEQEILELYQTDPTPLKPLAPHPSEDAVLEGFEENVEATWTGGVNTTSYKIYIGTDEENMSLAGETGVDSPAFSFQNLQRDTDYYWRVDAIGPEGTTTGATWTFRTTAPKGLVGYWKMDETSGLRVTDAAYYAHEGTVTGFPEAVWEAGMSGNAFRFSEPSDTAAIKIPHADHLVFENTSFTISLWVKIPEDTYAYGTDCYLMHKGTFESGTGKWYGIQLRDGRLTFAIDDGRTKTDISASVTNSASHPLFTDEWKNIVAVRDTKTDQIRLYMDGVKIAEKTDATGTIGKAVPLLLGNSPENKPYRDLMDEVKLYNYALTQEEIRARADGHPVKITYRDGDNGNSGDNEIRPFFRIVNEDDIDIPYEELSVRYWFTPEDYAGINAWIDYAGPGNGNISAVYHPLETPHNGAFGYVEYHFENIGGLKAGEETGVIESRLAKENWTDFVETGDYSYQQGETYAENNRITLYRNGQLIWGKEPGKQTPVTDLKVYSKNRNGNTNTNTIHPYIKIRNEGNIPLDYSDLELRYWFTAEGNSPLDYWIDYAELGNGNMEATFVKPDTILAGADTYFKLNFNPSAGQLYPLSGSGEIQYRIAKADWSVFDESDDHSFLPKAPFAENEHITLYYKGELIYGTEPGSNNNSETSLKTTADNNQLTQEVYVYPNPARDHVRVQLNDINDAGNIRLFNRSGRLLHNRAVKQNTFLIDLQRFPPGIYILEIENGKETTTHKIIKK